MLYNYKSLCVSILLFWILSGVFSSKSVAQSYTKDRYTLSDTNQYGNLNLYLMKGARFSFKAPNAIFDTLNLNSALEIESLYDFSSIRNSPEWNNYGWFELAFSVDSTIAGVPFVLSYRSQEAVNVWLNGKLVIKAGNPSNKASEEILARFINPIQTGVTLREGLNYVLIELSSHSLRPIHDFRRYFTNGIYLGLLKNFEPYQRRERAFVFGGAILLLFNLVLIHVFLAYRFKGSYHIYVALLTFFMLLHAFTTMSDTIINWSNSYSYFYIYTYALAYIFVVYFFVLAIRKFYELDISWLWMNVLLFASCFGAIVIAQFSYEMLGYFHQSINLSVFAYGGYSLVQAWKIEKKRSVLIIASGLGLTLIGTFIYVFTTIILKKQIDWLFYSTILLSYGSIPISLTLVVASSYAKLISTLEEKVIERTSKLELAKEFQQRFFANVSHEFRTPLTISEGLLSKVITKGKVQDEQTMYDLWLAKRNMLRLHDMVNQIIELTKADHHELKLNKKFYYIAEIVGLCVESFRSLAENHDHSFTYELIDERLIVHVDVANVEIIINNLISNAIKYTPEGGIIIIRSEQRDGHIVIQVEDNGLGIPEEKREAIFERFHRISQENGDYVEGMGVGLELSRTLARLHKGDVIVRPNTPIGSIFECKLPLVTQTDVTVYRIANSVDLEEESVVKLTKSVSSNQDQKILLVEDNRDLMHYISSIIEEAGIVEQARNGREALEKMKEYTPDLIITDLMMPEMDGIALVETLSKHPKWSSIPIIILTAKTLDEEKIKLFKIGVVDYITKPFSAEQLMLKIKNLLKYYRARNFLKYQLKTNELSIPEEGFAQKVADCIHDRIDDNALTIDNLAESFAMSRSTFYRSLQLETGMTPTDFLREVRLLKAKEIVQVRKDIRLEVLANAVGYKSATNFRKMYEERFGEHPLGN